MSEDRLSEQAREAYAAAQKESDQAAERELHKSDSSSGGAGSHEGKNAGGVKGKSSKKEKKPKKDKASSHSESLKNSDATKEAPNHSEHDASGAIPDEGSQACTESSAEKEGGEAAGNQESSAASSSSDLNEELGLAQEERIAQLNDELARARADCYNLRQEYNAYVRRTKAEVPLQQEMGVAGVVNALMSVLDDIDLARQHGDLTGSFGAVATKLESTLETKYQVKRFGVKGEEFDPNLHQAIQMLGGEKDGKHIIDQVAQPGYRMGDKVLRPAMVIVGTTE